VGFFIWARRGVNYESTCGSPVPLVFAFAGCNSYNKKVKEKPEKLKFPNVFL
jgi:hypothetical protein